MLAVLFCFREFLDFEKCCNARVLFIRLTFDKKEYQEEIVDESVAT